MTLTKEQIEKFDSILARGLCVGIGDPDSQMCIEAAISVALGLPFNDKLNCISSAIRAFKIKLNDSYNWISPQSRAAGLRNLGIAQIGSAGIISDTEFVKLLAERTIRILIPTFFRDLLPNNQKCLNAALKCEVEGSEEAAKAAAYAADATYAAANAAKYAAAYADAAEYAATDAAEYAATDAAANAAAYAANAAKYAAYAATYAANAANAAEYAAAYAANAAGEKYLLLSAEIALNILKELKSPGVAYL